MSHFESPIAAQLLQFRLTIALMGIDTKTAEHPKLDQPNNTNRNFSYQIMDTHSTIPFTNENPGDETILPTKESLVALQNDLPKQHTDALKAETPRGWRFWTIIVSLCITSLLTAIEGTVTATALPNIARSLDSRELYVWVVNAIFLSRYD
jgi:hypothetical protein